MTRDSEATDSTVEEASFGFLRAVWRFLSLGEDTSAEERWQGRQNLAATVSTVIISSVVGGLGAAHHFSDLNTAPWRTLIALGGGSFVLLLVSARQRRRSARLRAQKDLPRLPRPPIGGVFRVMGVVAVLTLILAVLLLRPWHASGKRYPPTFDTAPAVMAADGLVEQLGVANVTAGDEGYQADTTASYDQVVKVELSYLNQSRHAELVDITPSFMLPSSPGSSPTRITARLTDSSAAVLTQSILVTLVGPSAAGDLQLIPGSVTWRSEVPPRDQAFHTTVLDDSALFSATPLANLSPGESGSIAFLLRYVIPGVAVSVYDRGPDASSWSTVTTGAPGSKVSFQIVIADEGDTPLSDMDVTDQLPSGATYVKGSAAMTSTREHSDQPVPDSLIDQSNPSTRLGSYPGFTLRPESTPAAFRSLLAGLSADLFPGESVTLTFDVRLGPRPPDGRTLFDAAGVESLGNDLIWNDALVTVSPASP